MFPLQTTVAASSVVFLLLLLAHHDASPDSRRRQRIDNLTYLVAFDLVDASDLLGVLSSPAARDAMETWVTWWVLGVACLNLVLPTLPLMALSRTRFGARRLPEVGFRDGGGGGGRECTVRVCACVHACVCVCGVCVCVCLQSG